MNTSGAETRDFVLVKFIPRHWKKLGSCRLCNKRRVHWHWRPTMLRIGRMLREVYEKPLMDLLNKPNQLLEHYDHVLNTEA